MINAIIQMFTSYVGSGIFSKGIYHIMALALLATVPCILRAFIFQRGGSK